MADDDKETGKPEDSASNEKKDSKEGNGKSESGKNDSESREGAKEGGKEEKGDKKGGEDKKEEKPKKKFHWTPLKVLALVAAVIVVLILGAIYLSYALSHETTDDAYTSGYIHQISSRVTSNVIELLIQDNQFVHKGQVLVVLDPRDYQVQVDRARANYDKALADFTRVDALKNDVAISKEDYDQTKTTLEVNKAALEDANNQLSYCTITAPSDGYIGNRTVDVGNRVTVGGALMTVVQDVWVVANFKETQLGKMKARQPGEGHGGRNSRHYLSRPYRQFLARHRIDLCPAAARQCDREFHQDRAARAH